MTDHNQIAAEIKKTYNLKYKPARFINRSSAFSFSQRTTKISLVMLGTDGRFWVVCPADASRLFKNGVEYAD
jgi:hypothetical protein